MSIVSIKDLLQAGVHFGHQSRFWNPKMEEYIFDTRKKISIINLETTQSQLNAAASRVESICSRGNKLLFVGTKRSASKSIREKASSLGLPYVDKRWLGGTLTNWKTIRSSIRRLSDLEEMMSSGRIEKLSKKEALEISREHQKLMESIGGIKNMKGLPDALFVIDVKHEKIAVTEAKKMGDILIVAINSDKSIKYLKGQTRPVNSLQKRIAILNAITFINFVIPFGSKTPLSLIKKIQPDVLVKGDEYSKEEVIGSFLVENYGGEVRLVNMVKDLSTTKIISRM